MRTAGAATGFLAVALVLAGCSSSDASDTATATSAAATTTRDLTTELGVSTSAGTGSTLEQLDIGGNESKYVLHMPVGANGKLPAVIVLHGSGGNGTNMEQISGMSRVADGNSFVAAYPDQTSVRAIRALITELVDKHDADPARIFVTGISHGAADSQAVACQLSDKIAAIAPIAAGLPSKLKSACTLAKPLPVMLIHGTADPIVPFGGGAVNTPAGRKNGTTVLSEPDTFEFWRGLDGCTGDTTSAPVANTSDTVTRTVGPSCDNGARVELYAVQGGGHTWPGGDASQAAYAAQLGALNTEFDASQAIWEFFSGTR